MTVEIPPQPNPLEETVRRPVTPHSADVSFRTYPCGSWSVIEAAGEIDLGVTPALRETLHRASSPRVVFDLRQVGFMDCNALGVLAEARRTSEAAGGSVRLVAPARAVRRLLEVSMLDAVLPSYSSVEEATR